MKNNLYPSGVMPLGSSGGRHKGRGSQKEGNLCNTSVIACQYLANQTKDLSLKRNQWRRERCIHQGDMALGRQPAQGWEGGWDWNNTNCRSGERAWLIDGVEPHRDWALTDDVSTTIDWCRRAPVLLKHYHCVTLKSLFCGFFLFLISFFVYTFFAHICILELLDVLVFQRPFVGLVTISLFVTAFSKQPQKDQAVGHYNFITVILNVNIIFVFLFSYAYSFSMPYMYYTKYNS